MGLEENGLDVPDGLEIDVTDPALFDICGVSFPDMCTSQLTTTDSVPSLTPSPTTDSAPSLTPSPTTDSAPSLVATPLIAILLAIVAKLFA